MSNMSLNILNLSETEAFHEKTLDIFQNIGVKIASTKIRSRLRQAGARVDDGTERVCFPREMVDELIKLAPSSVTMQELNGKQHNVSSGNPFFTAILLDPFISDYDDGPRSPVLEDVRKHTIIAQNLDRVGGAMRMQQSLTDIPAPECYEKTMEVFLCNFNKQLHIMPTDMANCHVWLELLDILQDEYCWNNGAPIASIASAVTSPLQLYQDNCNLIEIAVQRGFPLLSTVCPMAGATSPYSLSGSALIANVEALLVILVAQVLKPGHPCFYMGGASSVMDMRSGHDLYYKAEKAKFKLLACQLGKFYNLPVAGETGGTLTYRHDLQNGVESMSLILSAMLAGQAWFGGLGSLGNANGMSAEQMVIQDALLSMAEFYQKGVDLNNLDRDYKSIEQTGIGGNYMMDDLTLENLNGCEFFESDIFDLTGLYKEAPASIYEKAHQKVADIIQNHKPAVSDKTQEKIKAYFRKRITTA